MIQRFVYSLICMVIFTQCKKDPVKFEVPLNELIETTPPVQTAITIPVNNSVNGFYAALPGHYLETTKSYPLLVFVHGAGQLGNGSSELPLLLNDGVAQLLFFKKFPPNFSVKGYNFSFIILNPQFNTYPSLEDVEGFIQYAKKVYRVDTTRIYLSGLSMGGFVTTEMAASYPSQLAAIVPISGVLENTAVCKQIAEGAVPVWAFHNKRDPSINISSVENFIAAINQFTPALPPKLTVFDAFGHDAWTAALNPKYQEQGMNVYEWMLQYSRK